MEHHPITHRNFIIHMQGLIDNEQHHYSQMADINDLDIFDIDEENTNSDDDSIGGDSIQIRAHEVAADYEHREILANRRAATAEYFVIREWLLDHHAIIHHKFMIHMQGLIDNELHHYSKMADVNNSLL